MEAKPKPDHPLGVPLMDEDHARLEAMIARGATAPDHALEELLQAIVLEMSEHFEREEKLMRAQAFPGLHCHFAQHKLLLEEARRPGRVEPAGLRRHISEYVAQMVQSHVLTLDTVTAAFLKGEIGPASFDGLRLPIEGAGR